MRPHQTAQTTERPSPTQQHARTRPELHVVAALKAENADLRAKNQQTRNPAPRGSSSRGADATWSTPLCPTTRN